MKDASKEVLEKWFETFHFMTEFYDIHSQNIYNMDESGFSIGEIEASRVVVNKKVRQKCQAQPGRQEWVTAVETICIDGTAISSLIIFKGKTIPPQWISSTNIPLDWQFDHNQKGWTSNEHGLQWLVRCFEPCT
jgi:hypothetical protein